MAESPIIQTMEEMLAKLATARTTYREAENSIAEYTNAITALAKVCEDEEVRNEYLTRLEEVNGAVGFKDAVRGVLGGRTKPLTPQEIRTFIIFERRMELKGYSNVMASIHTTLRRMKDKGEIEEMTNQKGEKAYRLKLKELVKGSPSSKPQERFSLAHTRPAKKD